jgi:hypothetical protein
MCGLQAPTQSKPEFLIVATGAKLAPALMSIRKGSVLWMRQHGAEMQASAKDVETSRGTAGVIREGICI